MKQDNNKNSYNAVPDAAVKTTPTGRRVVLAAALSFCLGALAATAGAPASKALRGSTNLATTSGCCLHGSFGTKIICGKTPRQCNAATRKDKDATFNEYLTSVSSCTKTECSGDGGGSMDPIKPIKIDIPKFQFGGLTHKFGE